MSLLRAIVIALLVLLVGCGGSSTSDPVNPPDGGGGGGGGTVTGQYIVLAWSELGMHCMDGKDYSVFSVLPPYNTIHAQVFKRADPPVAVTSGITVTYEAVADPNGSINTGSASKTNFWSYVTLLFHATVAPDIGLTGNATQSLTPHPLSFDSGSRFWIADAIPTVPYDDAGRSNAYPMAKIVVKDAQQNILATTTVVLSVSDEMTCSTCHASNSNSAARPASGWENATDPAKDVKWNILKLHDDREDISGMLGALASAGYTYQASLYNTAKAGTPILCAACHQSNALGTAGISPAAQLTTAMHSKHGPVVNPSTNTTLDNATSPLNSCYLCHPGVNTKCQRGAMRNIACYDCHGNVSAVGSSSRAGWLDVPACQMCHNNTQRYTTTFSSPGVWRTTTDTRFATNPNVPTTGKSLFRYSSGHGGTYCSACHGSPHAEYPTALASDNAAIIAVQGFAGKLNECGICHSPVPASLNGGPHGMHTVGQDWVNRHGSYADSNHTQCAACHGTDYRGTVISSVATARTFSVEGGSKTFAAGSMVGCYSCHNGPSGGD